MRYHSVSNFNIFMIPKVILLPNVPPNSAAQLARIARRPFSSADLKPLCFAIVVVQSGRDLRSHAPRISVRV